MLVEDGGENCSRSGEWFEELRNIGLESGVKIAGQEFSSRALIFNITGIMLLFFDLYGVHIRRDRPMDSVYVRDLGPLQTAMPLSPPVI